MDTVLFRCDYYVIIIITEKIPFSITTEQRSQCPRSIRHRSACRSPVEIVSSNFAGGMDLYLVWVLLGCSICDQLITRPEDCVVVCGLETSRTRGPCSALGRSAKGELPVNKFNVQWKHISLATSRGPELRQSYRQVWYRKNVTNRKTVILFLCLRFDFTPWFLKSRNYSSDFGQLQVISVQMSTKFSSAYIKRRKCVTLIWYSQDEASVSICVPYLLCLSQITGARGPTFKARQFKKYWPHIFGKAE
jgi:hypothetical protein